LENDTEPPKRQPDFSELPAKLGGQNPRLILRWEVGAAAEFLRRKRRNKRGLVEDNQPREAMGAAPSVSV